MKYCFVVNVHNDQILAARLIDSLVGLYPDSRVRVILDGVNFVYKHPRVDIKSYPQEKSRVYGAKWILRYVNEGVISGAEYIIKIDPDAYVLDMLTGPPKADIFGDILDLQHGRVPSSGVYGLTRAAARRMVDIHGYILALDKYKKVPGYLSGNKLVISEDDILCDIISILNLDVQSWDCIKSRSSEFFTQREVESFDGSVIHPYIGGI